MADRWAEFHRRVALWRKAGDAQRLKLAELNHECWQLQETDPEQALALFTNCRDEAQRLQEPWWVLFFESSRLNALTSWLTDFSRALPLAMELLVRFSTAEGLAHSDRVFVLDNVLCTHINIDPLGFRDEIERGIVFLDNHIPPGPVSPRMVLHQRWSAYLNATSRYHEAYEVAMRCLGFAKQLGGRYSRQMVWHSSWALYQICRSCHALGRFDELAAQADHMEELAAKEATLRRAQADAWFWRSLVQRTKGDERPAARSFHRGLSILDGIAAHDTACAEPMAAYYEACADFGSALGIRDRELAAVAKQGRFHRVCQIHIERCRLLTLTGELSAAHLSAARQAASRLRDPRWYDEKLARFEQNN